MTYIGSWDIDDLLTFYCNTQVFATGVATDADSVPSYRVYEDETGTPLLTGSMALLDSANTAGYYSEQITLSAANGFEKGKCYSIYIAATVSSVAGATHRTFQIRAEVNAATWNDLVTVELPLVPTTAGRKLDVSAGGEAGIDWSNVGSPTTSLALTGTTIAVTQKVDVDTIKTNPVVNGGTITFPTNKTLAATDNITAGTITTVTTVTAVTGLTASNLDATISSRLASATYVSPTTALTESYSALHAAPTEAQLLFEIRSLLAEKAVAATTLTAKKIDGATTAMTFTLNDAVTPTAITRAT